MSWFDIFILCILILSFIKGYSSGLVMQLATLVGFIACAMFAGVIASWIAPHLLHISSISPHILSPLSYILAFILIMLTFIICAKMIQSALKAVHLNPINRFAGGCFCTLKWLIIISILLNIIIAFDLNKKLIKQEMRDKSIFLSYTEKIAPSFIPFLKFEILK